MTKIRIYELAKELNIPTKDLMDKILELKIPANSHMSTIDEEEAELIKEIIEEESDNKVKDKIFEDSPEVHKNDKIKNK